jgi:hypothetical protein
MVVALPVHVPVSNLQPVSSRVVIGRGPRQFVFRQELVESGHGFRGSDYFPEAPGAVPNGVVANDDLQDERILHEFAPVRNRDVGRARPVLVCP